MSSYFVYREVLVTSFEVEVSGVGSLLFEAARVAVACFAGERWAILRGRLSHSRKV
jgi:hypothetical protein